MWRVVWTRPSAGWAEGRRPTEMATSGAHTPSVRRNIAWSTIGNVFYNLCLWGMMVVLARSDPSAQRVGLFAIGYAVNLPIFMFFSLQLRAVQATDARRSYAFSDYFTLRLLSLPAAFLVVALVLLAGPYDGVTARTIAAVALVKALDLLSDCFQGLFQQHERMGLTAISMIARGTIAFTTLVLGLRATGDLTTAILMMAGALLLPLVLVDWVMARPLLAAAEAGAGRTTWSVKRALLGARLDRRARLTGAAVDGAAAGAVGTAGGAAAVHPPIYGRAPAGPAAARDLHDHVFGPAGIRDAARRPERGGDPPPGAGDGQWRPGRLRGPEVEVSGAGGADLRRNGRRRGGVRAGCSWGWPTGPATPCTPRCSSG